MTSDIKLYFYLSHAEASSAVLDHWALTFYNDLASEVARHAHSTADIGMADFHLRGEDRDEAVRRAVANASVLVTMLSPEYVAQPRRAENLFRARGTVIGDEDQTGYIQPLLWQPVSSASGPDREAALALGTEFEEYARLGLRGMCQLREFAQDYQTIVSRLAERIVGIAEHTTIPSPLPPTTGVADTTDNEAEFIVAVIAPSSARIPQRRDTACYGIRPVMWRPFRNSQDVPVAEYTSRVAKSLRLPTRIVDFATGASSLETSPGVILFDPWMLDHPEGPALFRAALRSLRAQWVTVMIVVDRSDPQYADHGIELADKAFTMGERTRGLRLARDASEFQNEVTRAIARTRQRFITRPHLVTHPPAHDRLDEADNDS